MGKEGLKVKDRVILKLYDEKGHLKVGSPKERKSKVDKILNFLLKSLEDELD